jgi:hypothetical protein
MSASVNISRWRAFALLAVSYWAQDVVIHRAGAMDFGDSRSLYWRQPSLRGV